MDQIEFIAECKKLFELNRLSCTDAQAELLFQLTKRMLEVNKSMNLTAITDEKTVIFISHRLSTTRMADRIYMFENGSIIESGSHEELMEQNGKYAEMFRLQAEKYQTKE